MRNEIIHKPPMNAHEKAKKVKVVQNEPFGGCPFSGMMCCKTPYESQCGLFLDWCDRDRGREWKVRERKKRKVKGLN